MEKLTASEAIDRVSRCYRKAVDKSKKYTKAEGMVYMIGSEVALHMHLKELGFVDESVEEIMAAGKVAAQVEE